MKTVKILAYIGILFNCMIGASAIAQQISDSEIIQASLKTRENNDVVMEMLPVAKTTPKKNVYALPDASGSIMSPDGKVIGRLRFIGGGADRLENNNYRISNTGQIIDFSGNLIGYIHPRFVYNKSNLSVEIY